MATTKGGIVAQMTKNQTAAVSAANGIKAVLENPMVKEKFLKIFSDPHKADVFLASAMTLVAQKPELQGCTPKSILSCLSIAASFDMPVNQNLGYAYFVPYKGECTFQMGYKGYVAMAQRSGMMKSIVATEVYEGEIKNFNRFTETFEIGERTGNSVIGYYASFELVNGFKKCVFWKVEDVKAHAKRFSKTYSSSTSPWQTDFNAMACKTLLKALLSKYAPLSSEMQLGVSADGAKKLTLTTTVILQM